MPTQNNAKVFTKVSTPPYMKYGKYCLHVIVMLFILLWIYAAVNKLMDYSQFKFQLGKSPYVTNIAGFVAWALPFGELAIAALLLFKRTTAIGIYASFFLMLLFTGYIYAMQHYSYFVPCSCGGILNKMDWNTHFYFNIVFTLLGLTGIFLQRKTDSSLPEHGKLLKAA